MTNAMKGYVGNKQDELGNTDELKARQVALEIQAAEAGMVRAADNYEKAKARGSLGSTQEANIVMSGVFDRVNTELKKLLECKPVGAKIVQVQVRELFTAKELKMSPEIATLITLRLLFNHLATSKGTTIKYTSCAISIGAQIVTELKHRAFIYSPETKPIAKASMKRLQGKSPHMQEIDINALIRRVISNEQFTLPSIISDLSKEDYLKIGSYCITAAINAGLIKYGMVNIYVKGRKTFETQYILLYDDVIDKLDEYMKMIGELRPVHNPMICPPKPWTNLFDGGYYIEKTDLIRNAQQSQINKFIEHPNDLKHILTAVNKLQNTAYRINNRVYEVFTKCLSDTALISIFPHEPDKTVLICPKCGEQLEPQAPGQRTKHVCFDDKATLKAWIPKAKQYYADRVTYTTKYLLYKHIHTQATQVKDYERIWFAYNCDYRGRIYPISDYMHPQGIDISKALLEFAEGKRIDTADALLWMKRTGAGVIFKDKLSVNEQVSKIDSMVDEIQQWAKDPIANNGWTKADKPWQALAWAVDYTGYLANPETYESHAICRMDGSCNGLQHLSAISCDATGGAAVNLTRSGNAIPPADIYQQVCDSIKGYMQAKLQDNKDTMLTMCKTEVSERQLCNIWLSDAIGLSRKTVKKAVMVIPYNGTLDCVHNHISEWLQERRQILFESICSTVNKENPNMATGDKLKLIDKEMSVRWFFDDDEDAGGISEYVGAHWFSKLLVEHIERALPKAIEVRNYISSMAVAVCKETDGTLTWRTPSGFWYSHRELNVESDKCRTILGGIKVRLNYNSTVDITDNKSTKSQTAPNFIHSLDASMLSLTLLKMPENIAFAPVHDSYGTHAADAPLLAATLREVFIHMYANTCVLKDLRNWLNLSAKALKQLGNIDDLRGSLNIQDVSDNPYFFG